jgi:septal ring factor EnvC (AmiA/AmiB activator)
MPRKPKEPSSAKSAVQHYLNRMSPDRLDRVEANLEEVNATIARMAQQQEGFQLDMRAAILVQQEQIADNARQIGEVARNAAKHDKAIATLEKQFEAYLRRNPQ